MSGTIIHSKDLREDPFFEIAGIPGRLYLESFSFGDLDPLDHLRGKDWIELRLPERSPLRLVPDPKKQGSSLLLKNLDKYRGDRIIYDVSEKIGSCSIGADWKTDGRTVTSTIYLLFKCDLSLLRLFGVIDNEFKIEFGHLYRVGSFLTKRSW